MGFLSAFARGAAGPGLLQVAQMQQRQQEMEAAAAERERMRQEDKDFRLQLAKDQQAGREELLRLRDDLKGGASGSRSGGGGGGDFGDEDAAVFQIMQRTGASEPEARRLLQAARSGENPYRKTVSETQAIDDGDRMRNVTTQSEVPDLDAYMKLNRMVAEALITGTSNMKAKPDERARARQTDAETDAALAYGTGDVGAGRTGMMLKGKGEYGNNGSSELTGAAAKGSVAASVIRKNDGETAKAREGGGASTAKLPPAVKEQLDNLDAREREISSAIVKVQAAGEWNPAGNPGQKELQTALAAVRLKRQQLMAPYMPKAPGGTNDDPFGLLKDGPAPAAAPAPKKPEPRADTKQSAPKDAIQSMDDRTLKRLAAIDGHAQQKAAKAELERREKERKDSEPDTSQFGFGGMLGS